jgi:hypothetical protein
MIPDVLVSRHQTSCKQTTRMATGIMEVLAWIMHLKQDDAGGNLTTEARMHQHDMEIVLLVLSLDDDQTRQMTNGTQPSIMTMCDSTLCHTTSKGDEQG